MSDVLYCGHWDRAARRFCASTRGVRLVRLGFRCRQHAAQAALLPREGRAA
ncbi:hypothetical protein [Streptomyces smyrnaeus]|uniref:hypothetical protein n=1 Tax=Streptomyces smyrnaeus TaxID=1387713 RepID=UPI0033E29034